MKKNILFLTTIMLFAISCTYAQNDSIYFWKSGHVVVKQSIKPADLDTIMFRKFPVANLPNVTICNQVWSSANLDVTTYSDGTPILEVSTADGLANIGSIGAFFSLGTGLGKLYNWYAVVGIYNAASLSNPNLRKKLAPNGWHIPSDAEWTTLTTCLAPNASNKMVEVNSLYWAPSVLVGANNMSGFSARGAGYYQPGVGSTANYLAMFWSSTEAIPAGGGVAIGSSYTRKLPVIISGSTPGSQSIQSGTYQQRCGCSVRCIRD